MGPISCHWLPPNRCHRILPAREIQVTRGAVVRDPIERHDTSLGQTLPDRTILPLPLANGRLKSATSFPGAVRNNDPSLKRTNRLRVYSGCPPRVESRRDSPETGFSRRCNLSRRTQKMCGKQVRLMVIPTPCAYLGDDEETQADSRTTRPRAGGESVKWRPSLPDPRGDSDAAVILPAELCARAGSQTGRTRTAPERTPSGKATAQ